jgi:D-tyrosyl-tRNA(Tyr) deacylase
MRAVVQRVKKSHVEIEDQIVGQIGHGLTVLLGVEEDDEQADGLYLAEKIANLRIFEDADGKMNASLLDVGGALLVISQFTLMGDARRGRRPSFSKAARPEKAIPLYEDFITKMREKGIVVETGVFQADMTVHIANDGPVTLLLDSKKGF